MRAFMRAVRTLHQLERRFGFDDRSGATRVVLNVTGNSRASNALVDLSGGTATNTGLDQIGEMIR